MKKQNTIQNEVEFKPQIKYLGSAKPNKWIDIFLDKMVPAIHDLDNAEKMVVEIHDESDYDKDMSEEAILLKIGADFSKNKKNTGLDTCRTWTINEYYIVVQTKKGKLC